jgi:hypothetical protein
MNNQTYAVSDNVEKFCVACDEQLGHVVKSLTKAGAISRVSCSKCGLLGAYKASTKLTKIQNLATKTGEPYDQTKTYRTRQIMEHHKFGVGEVITVFDTKTIDVLFMDRVRRLIHSRD